MRISTMLAAMTVLASCGGGARQAAPATTHPVATKPQPAADPAPTAQTAPAKPPEVAREADLEFHLFTIAGLVTAGHPTDTPQVISVVMTRIGLADAQGIPDQALLTSFNDAYVTWAQSNSQWLVDNMEPTHAEAYWAAHKDDPVRRWTAAGWK